MSTLNNVELVMWSPAPGAEPPSVAAVRDRLGQHGLKPERATDVPESTAFRRAVKSLEQSGTKERPGIAATCWAKDGTTFGQLDEVRWEGTRCRREWLASYSMGKDGIGYVQSSGAVHLDGLTGFLATYTWADVSVVINSIFREDGLGSYSPRKAGGIYFVPVIGRELLDSLEAACRGFGMSLLRYQVPDSDAQRAEVADAVAHGIGQEIDAHESAVAGYTADTRAGAVEARREAIAATRSLIERLVMQLNGREFSLQGRLTTLDARCVELVTTIQSSKPGGSLLGGRRIVMTEGPLFSASF